MRQSVWIRAAAVVTFVLALGHLLGARKSWSPPGETAVFQAMRAYHFDVMGASRSYWDVYFGFGLYGGLCNLLQAVLLWQLAGIARTDPARTRPIAVSFLAFSFAVSLVLWRYIFVLPFALQAAVTMCLALAAASKDRREASAAA